MLKIKKANVEIFKKHNTCSEKLGGYLTYHLLQSKIWGIHPLIPPPPGL